MPASPKLHFAIRSDGVCRLNPEMAKHIANFAIRIDEISVLKTGGRKDIPTRRADAVSTSRSAV
jgi:hypothetical protein